MFVFSLIWMRERANEHCGMLGGEKLSCSCEENTNSGCDCKTKNWVCRGKEKNIINAYLNALIRGCSKNSNCPGAGSENLECKKLVLEHYEKLYYCYVAERKVRAKKFSVLFAFLILVVTVLACTLVPNLINRNVVKTENTTKINIVESRNYGRE